MNTNNLFHQNNHIPKASVIIAVYNHADFLEKIFLSLLNQTENAFEIIVSDDGSGSEIKTVISGYTKKFRYPIKHAWHENNGFQKTVIANKAAQLSESEYLIFIDGDCILHSKFIERHLRRKQLHHVLAGRRVNLDNEITQCITNNDIIEKKMENPAFWKKNCQKSTIKYGIYNPLQYYIRSIFSNRYDFIGCNFSLYKKSFFDVNGYDERIVTRGMEDDNLCSRLQRSGKKIQYISREAIQYHLFHTFEHVEYPKEIIEKFKNQAPWTPHGIVKM